MATPYFVFSGIFDRSFHVIQKIEFETSNKFNFSRKITILKDRLILYMIGNSKYH